MTRHELTVAGKAVKTNPLIEARGVTVRFPLRRRSLLGPRSHVHAVEDVSLKIRRGETLGLVGESGSGKSTLGRAMLLATQLTSGKILFDGMDITGAEGDEKRAMQRFMQPVFQDPYASLDGRMTVGDIIAEPIRIHNVQGGTQSLDDRVAELLRLVGLSPAMAKRHPHSFSGGQRQRIGIARALAISPEFIVADEAVSALDVSVRAQVVNVFQDLQSDLGLTYLFIAHDLALVRYISDRIAVMYAGRIVEIGSRDAIYDRPVHPYTRALIDAVLEPDPRAMRARPRQLGPIAEPPSVVDPGPGCAFRTRCPLAESRCGRETPHLVKREGDHSVACFAAAAA